MNICSVSWPRASHNSRDESIGALISVGKPNGPFRGIRKVKANFSVTEIHFKNTRYKENCRASCFFDSYNFHANWLRLRPLFD